MVLAGIDRPLHYLHIGIGVPNDYEYTYLTYVYENICFCIFHSNMFFLLKTQPFHISYVKKKPILTFDRKKQGYFIHCLHFFNIVRRLKKISLFGKLFYRLKQKHFTKCIYLPRRSFLILYKIKEIPIRTPWPPKEVGGLSMLYVEADPDSSQSTLLMHNLNFSVPWAAASRDAQEQGWAASATIR
jgi:hypothetical protein